MSDTNELPSHTLPNLPPPCEETVLSAPIAEQNNAESNAQKEWAPVIVILFIKFFYLKTFK